MRISEDLRSYLERARDLISNHHGESVSTSDIAKLLLESAKDDKLDDRLEMAELRANPTQVLWTLRLKWEQKRDLSRAEWMFLAQYVQVGCEGLADDPDLPKPDSFAQVLATQHSIAVRALIHGAHHLTFRFVP